LNCFDGYHSRVAASTVRCLNCGQPAGPAFCGHCGQAIDDRRSPLLSLTRELLEEWFSVDGRALRTLRTLLHPGRLTRLYLDGKRVPFLAPFRLYLLSSLLLFSSVLTLEPPDAGTLTIDIAGVRVQEGPTSGGRVSFNIVERQSLIGRWITTRYADKFAKLRALPPQELVNRLFDGIRRVLPMTLIAFVPVLALAIKVLYYRRHILYVDHLVFAVHFQSALFVAMSAMWVGLRVIGAPVQVSVVSYLLLFLLMITVYLNLALRPVYGEARLMRWGKTALIVFAYMAMGQWIIGPAVLFVLSRM
jgi:uncharacterized protein DUF3667